MEKPSKSDELESPCGEGAGNGCRREIGKVARRDGGGEDGQSDGQKKAVLGGCVGIAADIDRGPRRHRVERATGNSARSGCGYAARNFEVSCLDRVMAGRSGTLRPGLDRQWQVGRHKGEVCTVGVSDNRI